MTDTSKDAVDRYSVKPWDSYRASMAPDGEGNWVEYSAYAALAAENEALRAQAVTVNRGKMARAIWTANHCDVSYDEALKGAERGNHTDAAALLYNQELVRAAISAIDTRPTYEVAAQAHKEGMEEAVSAVWHATLEDAHKQGHRVHYDDLQEYFSDAIRALIEKEDG